MIFEPLKQFFALFGEFYVISWTSHKFHVLRDIKSAEDSVNRYFRALSWDSVSVLKRFLIVCVLCCSNLYFAHSHNFTSMTQMECTANFQRLMFVYVFVWKSHHCMTSQLVAYVRTLYTTQAKWIFKFLFVRICAFIMPFIFRQIASMNAFKDVVMKLI